VTTTEQNLPGGDLGRFVVLANPVSANARRIGRQVRELERSATVPVTVVETSRNPDRTRDTLRKILRDGDWLGIGAGDGTVNLAVGAVNATPVAPLAGGNANDIAHMLHTSLALRQPRHILEQGQIVPVHPLYCRITQPDSETVTKLAAGYISLGASGRAAHEINQSRDNLLRKVPGLKKAYIGAQVFRGLMLASEFKMHDDTGTHIGFETVFPNGDRMAEHLRWQTDITDPASQEISIGTKGLLPIAAAIGRSLVGRLTGPELSLGDERSFTIQDEAYLQTDGEAMALAAGTALQIGISAEPFYAVSTKLLAS
jgi:diacylglycerol kinase family enzyme